MNRIFTPTLVHSNLNDKRSWLNGVIINFFDPLGFIKFNLPKRFYEIFSSLCIVDSLFLIEFNTFIFARHKK